MLSPVYIGNLEVSRTRLANSKAHVCVEIHVEQERSAVQPIIVSTSGCFERCDVQIILSAIGCGINLDELWDLLGTKWIARWIDHFSRLIGFWV